LEESSPIVTEPPPNPQGNDNGMLTFQIPRGNATLIEEAFGVDYIRGLGRQFLTVQTRGGNTFYIIIETDVENAAQNVFFLNAVDDWDLFAFAEDFPDDFYENMNAQRNRPPANQGNTGNSDNSANLDNSDNLDNNGGTQKPAAQEPTGRSSNLMRNLVIFGVVIVGMAVFYLIMRKKKSAPRHDDDEYEVEE